MVLLGLLSVPGWSDILYSDGGVNGSIGAFPIYDGNEVTDSFTISSSSTVTGVSNVGLWAIAGDIPTDLPATLSWVISTSPDGGGTVEGSGSGVGLSTSLFGIAFNEYFVYSGSFTVGSVTLSAGTYYLELENAVPSPYPGSVGWDINTGPSTADVNGSSVAAESFEIDGTVNAPEPTTTVLFGMGLAALAGVPRLRRNR
jgi:hypothetical protein